MAIAAPGRLMACAVSNALSSLTMWLRVVMAVQTWTPTTVAHCAERMTTSGTQRKADDMINAALRHKGFLDDCLASPVIGVWSNSLTVISRTFTEGSLNDGPISKT
jgi:hypothetical protein